MTSINYCDSCGTPMIEGRTYCITCGKKYSKMTAARTGHPEPAWAAPTNTLALPPDPPPGTGVLARIPSSPGLAGRPDVASPPPPDGEPPRSGRPAALVVAIALTVALIAGGLVLILRPSDKNGASSSSPATSPSASVPTVLTLAFDHKRPYRFHLEYSMDAWFVAPTEGYSRLIMKVDETAALRVLSTDRAGTVTVKMSIERGAIFVNGERYRIPAGTSLRLKIARDGRIVSTGDGQVATPSKPGGLPSIDQFTPLLPPDAVTPGDTWVKDFAIPYPLGGGTLKYHAENEFVGFEDLSGTRAAVIHSEITVPVKLVIPTRRFFEAAGADPSNLPPEAVGTLRYAGSMSASQENWLDPERQREIKATSHGTMDFRMRISGFQAGNSVIRFQGSFDTVFENLT